IGRAFDICFLRAYENGKPAIIRHYLKCNRNEPRENDLTFMAGCPALSRRHFTVAEVRFLKEEELIYSQRQIRQIRLLDEQRRLRGDSVTKTEVEYFHTTVAKNFSDRELLLLRPDSELVCRREAREAALQAAVDRDPRLQKTYGGAWQR